LKEPSDLENDYKHFITLLQEAAKMATPHPITTTPTTSFH
jgi:hypothetical protein